MRHEILSPLIKIDELPNEHENPTACTYFLTRPMVLPPNARASSCTSGPIYTSAFLKHFLRKRRNHDSIVATVHTLDALKRQRIRLSDGSSLFVVLLPTDSAEHNVMLLLELNDRRVLYTGDFTEFRSVLRSCWLQIDRPHIHTLYVDNTVAGRPLTIPLACAAIRDIAARHADCRLRLPLPDVGHEDLIVALASPPFSFRITVGSVRMHLLRYAPDGRQQVAAVAANITRDKRDTRIVVVIDEPTSPENYRKFRRMNYVTVRLVEQSLVGSGGGGVRPAADDLGLYTVNYTPHANQADVLELLEHVKAEKVRGIHTHVKGGDDEDEDDVGGASMMLRSALQHDEDSDGLSSVEGSMAAYEGDRAQLLAVFGDRFNQNAADDDDAHEVAVAEDAAESFEGLPSTEQMRLRQSFDTVPEQATEPVAAAAASAADDSTWLNSADTSRCEASVCEPYMIGCSLADRSRQLWRGARQQRQHRQHRMAALGNKKRPRVEYVDDE